MIFFYEYKIDLVNSIKIFRVKVKLLPSLRGPLGPLGSCKED